MVEVKVFNRCGIEKDERSLAIERTEINKLLEDRDTERKILETALQSRLRELFVGQTATSIPNKKKVKLLIDDSVLDGLTDAEIRKITIDNNEIQLEIDSLVKHHENKIKQLYKHFEDKVEKNTAWR